MNLRRRSFFGPTAFLVAVAMLLQPLLITLPLEEVAAGNDILSPQEKIVHPIIMVIPERLSDGTRKRHFRWLVTDHTGKLNEKDLTAGMENPDGYYYFITLDKAIERIESPVIADALIEDYEEAQQNGSSVAIEAISKTYSKLLSGKKAKNYFDDFQMLSGQQGATFNAVVSAANDSYQDFAQKATEAESEDDIPSDDELLCCDISTPESNEAPSRKAPESNQEANANYEESSEGPFVSTLFVFSSEVSLASNQAQAGQEIPGGDSNPSNDDIFGGDTNDPDNDEDDDQPQNEMLVQIQIPSQPGTSGLSRRRSLIKR